MKQLLLKLSIYINMAVVISGCTSSAYNINIDDISTYPTALFEPLPLTVGVYYSDDFSTYRSVQVLEASENYTYTQTYKIQMGKANVALFEYILSSVFQKHVSVQNIAVGLQDAKLFDLILEPVVYDYNYHPTWATSGTWLDLTYDINIYLPDGGQLCSWQIEGNGIRSEQLEIKSYSTFVIAYTQMAMREIAAKFIVGFCEQEKINTVFDNQCGK